MSLNELRAEAEKIEELAEVEELELQDEPLDEGSSEDEGTETEESAESEDFELELDGESEPDQQKPNAEQALVHKLTKQRKKRQEAESEVAELRRQLDELKSGKSAQPTQTQSQAADIDLPRVPDMYDKGIDGDHAKYDKALKAWFRAMREAENAQTQKGQQTEQQRAKLEEKTLNLAKRTAKFMQENKISESRVISAIERATSEVDAATKVDGALAHLLDSVGDGGERVAYYIGTNEAALERVKASLAADPSGFKTIAMMTRMVSELKPKHSQKTSKAPTPDEPLRGDGSPVSAKRLQEKYDKATNPNELFKLRQEAKKLGVKLS